MKICSNRDINRDHKNVTPTDVPSTVIAAARHDPVGTTIPHILKILTETDNDEKFAIAVLIVVAGLIAYHF